MPRAAKPLTSLRIARAKTAGYIADGGATGLYLQITPPNSKTWIFRFTLAGRRREMGLGSFPGITLAAARRAALEARAMLAAGQDPIEARDALRARQRLEEARGVTFEQAAGRFLADHLGTWKNPKHRAQWRSTLATYVYPEIGSLAVAAIGTPEVTKILDPIWKQLPETASRVRGRIERVLDWARARGYRSGENPARWRGHLDAVYPARAKVRTVQHHAAVPIDDLPALYAELRKSQGMAALALRFVILTACRAGEVTGGAWPEIDRDAALWTLPATRMKAARVHRVTLSGEALAVLDEAAKLRVDQWIFPGGRKSRPLSLTALSKALKAAGGGDATVHGMRSTFRDWAAERTNFPRDVAEMCLAHAIGDRVEAAYRRGELLEKRAALMKAWAGFVTTPPSAKVVAIGRRRA